MATKKTNAIFDPATVEETNLLRGLENADREVYRREQIKSDAVSKYNQDIKDAEADRNAILNSLQDLRDGVQSLPLE